MPPGPSLSTSLPDMDPSRCRARDHSLACTIGQSASIGEQPVQVRLLTSADAAVEGNGVLTDLAPRYPNAAKKFEHEEMSLSVSLCLNGQLRATQPSPAK